MRDKKVNLPKRHGISAVMHLAETAIYNKAEAFLSASRYEELKTAKGGALFIAIPGQIGSHWLVSFQIKKCSIKSPSALLLTPDKTPISSPKR